MELTQQNVDEVILNTLDALASLLEFAQAIERRCASEELPQELLRNLNVCSNKCGDLGDAVRNKWPNRYPLVVSMPLNVYLKRVAALEKHTPSLLEKVREITRAGAV